MTALQRWTSIPRLMPGDSLSGYVGRMASLHGLSRRDALLSLGWPERPGNLAPYIDLLAPDANVSRRFHAVTGLDPALLRDMTLERYDGFAIDLTRLRADAQHESLPEAFRRSWREHRWTLLGASPVCPGCLLERPGAHQILWRVGMLPGCLSHGQTLVSHCPRCDQPPFRPDPDQPSPWAEPGDTTVVACGCGAPMGMLADSQEPLDERAQEACRAVNGWLHAPQQTLPLVRDCQSWLQTLVVGMSNGQFVPGPAMTQSARADLLMLAPRPRGRSRARTHLAPGSSLTAALLPAAVRLVPKSPQHVKRHGTGHRLMQTARMLEACEEVDANVGSIRVHVRPSIERRRWRDYVPEVTRPPDFRAEHLPQLIPLPLFTAYCSDLLDDAVRAATAHGGKISLSTALTPLRATVSLGVACALWQQSLKTGASQLDGARRAPTVMRFVMDGLLILDTVTDFHDAIRNVCDDLLATPRIDYSWRRLHLPPSRDWLQRMSLRGVPEGPATLWLISDYACADPLGYGWKRRKETAAEMPSYAHLFSPHDEAAALDSALRQGAA